VTVVVVAEAAAVVDAKGENMAAIAIEAALAAASAAPADVAATPP